MKKWKRLEKFLKETWINEVEFRGGDDWACCNFWYNDENWEVSGRDLNDCIRRSLAIIGKDYD